ncbi:hypothetical protein IMG5_014270 [Ichthyophthirius multifiliis]|uniref:Zinc finger lsd1 subclass family protein n=1 Tax=Ichthyophthirius multifiliis TaxID=5932 RepID=G0QK82_ICHMU|nr:hypothetical protein IMG5_014270 [Ichthyophthirius multifiliis]EGR34373.1 hypothetical protein IMG5_014270 [Ichthyophthirius multifiliis]|eukprot:XP_004039677.1 hypothetical protein IMG5_014270 [Ichthyophthirius multifiliis]
MFIFKIYVQLYNQALACGIDYDYGSGGGFTQQCGLYNQCIIFISHKSQKPIFGYFFSFKYIIIDDWVIGTDFLSFMINGNISTCLFKNNASTNLCGQQKFNEEYQQADIEYITNNQELEIEITSNYQKTYDNYTRSFGITKLFIYAYECMPQCAGCTNGTSCSSCFKGYYLNIDECLHCILGCEECIDGVSCDLCKSGYFYYDSKCISSCPNGKYADSSARTCYDCNIKCITCSNATDCDTCFENRVHLLVNDYPQYSYDPKVFNQACTMCSTFSAGCVTCSTTE